LISKSTVQVIGTVDFCSCTVVLIFRYRRFFTLFVPLIQINGTVNKIIGTADLKSTVGKHINGTGFWASDEVMTSLIC